MQLTGPNTLAANVPLLRGLRAHSGRVIDHSARFAEGQTTLSSCLVMARNGRHSRGGTPFGSGRSSSPAQHSQRSEFDDQSGSDGDDSPAELYDDDSRVHSGAGTPARGARSDSKSFSQAQFVRRREAKVRAGTSEPTDARR